MAEQPQQNGRTVRDRRTKGQSRAGADGRGCGWPRQATTTSRDDEAATGGGDEAATGGGNGDDEADGDGDTQPRRAAWWKTERTAGTDAATGHDGR